MVGEAFNSHKQGMKKENNLKAKAYHADSELK